MCRKSRVLLILVLFSLAHTAFGADLSTVQDALAPYVGRWQTEAAHTSADGRAYRYQYHLAWFDSRRGIVRMTITQVFADGERSVAWNGYKGLDVVNDRIFYYGFSPSSRIGRGHVYKAENGHLVTVYEGLSLAGAPAVEIRDDFTPVENGRFASVSKLRRPGESEWRVIGRDVWLRMDGQ